MNKVWNGEGFPDESLYSYSKKKNKDVRNYRGIPLMDSDYKSYTAILREDNSNSLEKMKEENPLKHLNVLEKKKAGTGHKM